MIYVAISNALFFLRWALEREAKFKVQVFTPALIILFLFSAFRFEVGCDWSGYFIQYQLYGAFPLDTILNAREPLWKALFVIQTWLDLPYPWINVISSLIFFAGAGLMARRQPDPLAFLVLLFPILIINMPMSAIRQGSAIGVMFVAFMAFNDRKLLRFITLTIVATGFHSSALVFMMLAPLVNGNYSRQRLIIAVLLAIPGSIVLLTGDNAEVATSRYVNSDIDAAGAVFRVALLVLSSIYFFLFLRRKWEEKYKEDYKLALIGALLMVAIGGLLPISSVIADRLSYYLVPLQVMMLARIPCLNWRHQKSLHTAAPYLILSAVLVVWTSVSGHFAQCYIPYQTWLFGYPEQMSFSL